MQRTIVLIAVLALIFVSAPQLAGAQSSSKIYRIGWLGPTYGIYNKIFLKEFQRIGWVEKQDFVMEYRSVDGKLDRLTDHAAELADIEVDVILTALTPSTHAAKSATTKIPIVFTIVEDPVGDGFVASLARPGGNITGMSSNIIEIAGKGL
jgi:putative ABC transport system substrate-binding protein